ncbi:hypothetical protein EDD17DRAFT_1623646 [Pisolithus thermaeus]|nr:hypothetical protein EDD17DRAFT_1623646 [Pisolithus thermaeus]
MAYSKKRIPIVLVINHLERERDMEDWWRRNQGTLGTSMSGTRHTCVTGLPVYEEKWRKSREELVAVLRNEYPSRERTATSGNSFASTRRLACPGSTGSAKCLSILSRWFGNSWPTNFQGNPRGKYLSIFRLIWLCPILFGDQPCFQPSM